jgi:N-acetylglucosaminyl-diphospho-decaprenol L-rhamnosyltransferase
VNAVVTIAKLAVIIVNYNTKDLLRVCLESVVRQPRPQLEVWVVDNASDDGSSEMVDEIFPEVHLIALEENVGFAGGNNAALRTMGYAQDSLDASPLLPEYVLFLNPDTEVRDGALGVMVDFMDRNPNVGVVGCSLRYPDGRFQHSAFRFPTLWQIWFDFFSWPGRLVESSLNGRYSRGTYAQGAPFPVDHPLGAAMMTRREVIDDVGLMDEQFFMYAEEVDWNLRVHAVGYSVFCVPTAEIIHHGGASTSQKQQQMNESLWESRFRLFRKHYPMLFTMTAECIFRIGRWVRLRS